MTDDFLVAMDPLPSGPEGVVLELAPDRMPSEALIASPGPWPASAASCRRSCPA